MKIQNTHYHTIWVSKNNSQFIQIIDQRYLPFQFIIQDLKTTEDIYTAIKEMWVRGAPLIGVTAAYGMYLGLIEVKNEKKSNQAIKTFANYLKSARPTAVNLQYAVDLILNGIKLFNSINEKIDKAFELANQLKEKEIENCRLMGEYGVPVIEEISRKKKGETVNILTHCNAGWLACIDYGTATAPIYLAHDQGIPLHLWVDETRPRNQGARLTAFELGEHGVPHTVITDNAGGHLMQHGKVDMVLVGSDRTTRGGDVTNKIGTYLKALSASDNRVPFYVALPTSSIDPHLEDGLKQVPIEERDAGEVKTLEGWDEKSKSIRRITLTPTGSPALNPGFDVTPA